MTSEHVIDNSTQTQAQANLITSGEVTAEQIAELIGQLATSQASPVPGQSSSARATPDSATPTGDNTQVPPAETQAQDIFSQINEAFPATDDEPTQAESPQAQAEPQTDQERIDQLQGLFKQTLGVDVKDAVTRMQQFNETSGTVLQEMRSAENRVNHAVQRLELAQAWFQDAVQQNVPVTELVNQRLSTVAQTYGNLNSDLKKRIDNAGSQGIVKLWSMVSSNNSQKKPNTTTTVPMNGQATIADNQSELPRLSDLVAITDDNEYWRQLGQGYNDDLNLLGRR